MQRLLKNILILVLGGIFLNMGINFVLRESDYALKDPKIVIIGAGVSGIAVAHTLIHNGKMKPEQVIILEAQNRVGGRVETDNSLGVPVELGAAWIHHAGGNPITKLALEYGCTLNVTENTSVDVFDRKGWHIPDLVFQTVRNWLKEHVFTEILAMREEEIIIDVQDIDTGIKQILKELKKNKNWPDIHELLNQTETRENVSFTADRVEQIFEDVVAINLFRDVVQDMTADTDLISINQYDEGFHGGYGKDMLIKEGYSCLWYKMAQGLTNIKLNTVVQRIVLPNQSLFSWLKHEVSADLNEEIKIETNHGVYYADSVIVTVPLGVLKKSVSGTIPIQFVPPLPFDKVNAIRRLGVGQAIKIALKFPFIFWDPHIHFINRAGKHYGSTGQGSHWEFLNVARYTGVPILLGETEMMYADKLEQLEDKEIALHVFRLLREMYGEHIPEPIDYRIKRFGSNPFTAGGLSFWPIGSTQYDNRALERPVWESGLFFAGEATNWLMPGTVDGAYISGLQVAQRVMCHIHGYRGEHNTKSTRGGQEALDILPLSDFSEIFIDSCRSIFLKERNDGLTQYFDIDKFNDLVEEQDKDSVPDYLAYSLEQEYYETGETDLTDLTNEQLDELNSFQDDLMRNHGHLSLMDVNTWIYALKTFVRHLRVTFLGLPHSLYAPKQIRNWCQVPLLEIYERCRNFTKEEYVWDPYP